MCLWLWVPALRSLFAARCAATLACPGRRWCCFQIRLSKSRSVIASEAKQSRATHEALDCFGALRLAMTNLQFLIQRFKEHGMRVRILGPRSRPELSAEHHPLKSKRAQGMPGEGLTHGPPAIRKAGGSYHRFSRIVRHSLRDGVTAYSALSPGTGLSCPRRRAVRHRTT